MARQPDNCICSLLDCPISGVVVEIRLRVARVGGIDLDPVLRKVLGQRQGDRIQRRLGAVIRQNVHGVVGVCGIRKPCQRSKTTADHDDIGLARHTKHRQKRLRRSDRAENVGLVHSFDFTDFLCPGAV